jgi:hypothetical protein
VHEGLLFMLKSGLLPRSDVQSLSLAAPGCTTNPTI